MIELERDHTMQKKMSRYFFLVELERSGPINTKHLI
nr:MAG TPA: hypothetical protein [Caudoviricetes sp.]